MGLADIEIIDNGCGTCALESGGDKFAWCADREHAETIKRALERCAHELTAFACVVDANDHCSIMAAVKLRKAWDCEPYETDSCELGGMLAEICRGWMKRVEHDKRESERIRDEAAEALARHDAMPRRTENSDGTITFHGIDVTVSAAALEGRVVLAVRPPKDGECFLGWVYLRPSTAEGQFPADSPRLILGPKPQQPASPQPAFREGGFYRDRAGQLVGPLDISKHDNYAWFANELFYKADGSLYASGESPGDLLPGEVIVWRNPGLVAGEYRWDDSGMTLRHSRRFTRDWAVNVFAAWTDPPRIGKWKVSNGQEYATWEGE